jgi:hypothetical protein
MSLELIGATRTALFGMWAKLNDIETGETPRTHEQLCEIALQAKDMKILCDRFEESIDRILSGEPQ